MKCAFDYCIYNKEFACILTEIQINSLGMCEALEMIAIPKENLSEYKEKRLKEIERIWGDSGN